MPAGIGYGLKRMLPSYAGRNAVRAHYRAGIGSRGVASSRAAKNNPVSGRSGLEGAVAAAEAQRHSGIYRGSKASIRAGRDSAYNTAYNQQLKRNVKTGALVGAGIMLYPNTGQTGPNQNTFARRGMQNRRTVGISSGSLQGIQRASSMYGSIGSM